MIGEISRSLVELAIAEDIGAGDLTGNALIADDQMARATIVAREKLIVCGQEIASMVFREIDARVFYQSVFDDGAEVGTDVVFAKIAGPLRSILSGERTALNFLQRLSGVATCSAELSIISRRKGIKLYDTRKTTPGWRELEKYAVRTGGGANHRIGLFDAVLIKNNHVDALPGGIPEAVAKALAYVSPEVRVQVEVRSETELRQAIEAGAREVLLDNMAPEDIRKMVQIVRAELGRKDVFLEVSGGIDRHNLESYLVEGIDGISMGALTHSVRSVDISLRIA